MNVAGRRPRTAGTGSRRSLLDELFASTEGDARRGYTLEVRVSNTSAIALYERLGF